MSLTKFEKSRIADEILRDFHAIDKSPHFYQCLTRHALRNPDKSAVIFYGRDMTYRELDDLSSRFASALSVMGTKKGDRVGLFMQNCPQFWICFFGAQKIGAISVFLNPMNKPTELEHYVKNVQLDTIIVEEEIYKVVKKVQNRVTISNVFVTSPRDFLPDHPTITIFPGMDNPKERYEGTHDLKEALENHPPYNTKEVTEPMSEKTHHSLCSRQVRPVCPKGFLIPITTPSTTRV